MNGLGSVKVGESPKLSYSGLYIKQSRVKTPVIDTSRSNFGHFLSSFLFLNRYCTFIFSYKGQVL